MASINNVHILDIETTIGDKKNLYGPLPHDGSNKICMVGVKHLSSGSVYLKDTRNIEGPFNLELPTLETLPTNEDPLILVGVNIKFDLMWLYSEGVQIIARNGERRTIKRMIDTENSIVVWDCQLTEYMLQGQADPRISMETLTTIYNTSKKKSNHIHDKYWSKDIDTIKIPQSELSAYLTRDLDVTEEVFLAQIAHVEESTSYKFRKLLKYMHRALLALMCMEYRGMLVDKNILREMKKDREQKIKEAEETIISIVKKHNEDVAAVLNVGSPQQMAKIIYGGDFSFHKKEQVGFYKNGKPKISQVKYVATDPVFKIPYPELFEDGEAPKCKDEILQATLNSLFGAITTEVDELIRAKMQYTAAKKEQSTYIVPMLHKLDNAGLVHFKRYGSLHPSINQTIATTGRLTESKPNLQNVSNKSDLKRCFVPSGNSYIMELDYKQIEVIAAAIVSGDRQLQRDVSDGIDIHSTIGNDVFGTSMTDQQRRIVKSVVFGTIYGGGPKKLARESGVPLDTVQKISKAFHERYPRLKISINERRVELWDSAVPIRSKTSAGKPQHRAIYESRTGRLYSYTTIDQMYGVPGSTDFKYTEVANYPVQGIATGDIVPIGIALLADRLHEEEGVMMINTIHDSIILEIHHEKNPRDVAQMCKEILIDKLTHVMVHEFGIHELDELKLKIECKVYHKNWNEPDILL